MHSNRHENRGELKSTLPLLRAHWQIPKSSRFYQNRPSFFATLWVMSFLLRHGVFLQLFMVLRVFEKKGCRIVALFLLKKRILLG